MVLDEASRKSAEQLIKRKAPILRRAWEVVTVPGEIDPRLNRVDENVLPKQREFLNFRAPEVLYSGAYGAGKTRALCIKAVLRARHVGAREFLCRKHLVSLKATTLRTLLEPAGDTPPVLPPGTYHHHKQDRQIKIKGGGEIYYFGIDDQGKAGGLEFTGGGIDESVELTEQDWDQINGRLRLQSRAMESAGEIRQLYGACNPGPPGHFLAERFALVERFRAPLEGCRAVTTSMFENTFLAADYIERNKRLKGLAYDRFVLGLWVGSDFLVYPFRYDPNVRTLAQSLDYVICADYGISNPFAAARLEVTTSPGFRVQIAAERKKVGLPIKRQADMIESLFISKRDGERSRVVMPAAVVIDPSARALILECEDRGWPVFPGENSLEIGIPEVYQALIPDEQTGMSKLGVDPTCEDTIQEFGTYENIVDKRTGKAVDRPKKENDHLMDAVRYGYMWILRNMGFDHEMFFV